MLCYRLLHYEDELSNIKISLINRDEELSYPLLQLFYGTDAFEEIKTALEFFIGQRRINAASNALGKCGNKLTYYSHHIMK